MMSFPPVEVEPFQLSRDQTEVLTREGIPKEFFGARFRATRKLEPIETSSGTYICFGTSGYGVRICLDPRSGEVIQLVGSEHLRTFVNTSLRQFVKTIQAVLARFPFHGTDATPDDINAAARGVAAIISDVDAPAMIPDRFWSTMIDDIKMGDFDLEVLEALISDRSGDK
jgi:hypothetical protein